MEKDSKIIYKVWQDDPSANKEWINRNKEWLDNFNEKLKNIEKTYGTEAAFRIAHDFLYGDPVDGIKNIKIETIDATPTVDAVEVVRCKDCKWWKLSAYNTVGIHICHRFSGVRGEYDFCSRGERREDETN